MYVPEPIALHFVPLREAHLDEVMAIEVEAYRDPWTESLFREEIRNRHSYFYVACAGDALRGYGGFWLILDEAHITSVVVRDGFRRAGLGLQIMEFLLEDAARHGARIATLEVRPGNAPARRLYARLGFREIGVRKRYYARLNEDAIVMLKELDPPAGGPGFVMRA